MPHTWGSIYRNALNRGMDHGYANYLADQWEERDAKKKAKAANSTPPPPDTETPTAKQ